MSVTFIIIIITCIISFMAWQNPSMLEKSMFYPYLMYGNKREWKRFITAGFVHADQMHLAFNMFTLYFFGKSVESVFGEVVFVIFYLTALVASSLYNYFKHKHNGHYRALGASGAISALVFVCIILAPWASIYVMGIKMPSIVYAVLYVGYSIYMQKRQLDNVGHDVHLWGALYGVVFTFIYFPNALPYFIKAIGHPSF